MPKPKVTIKQRLLAVYAQGYDRTSDEAIKVAPNPRTRKEYWNQWQNAGMPGYVGRPVVEPEPDATTLPHPPEETPQGLEADIKKSALEQKDITALKAPTRIIPPRRPAIQIGRLTIPDEEWGYSDIYHMLVVAATYVEVKKPKAEGGYDYGGTVGDFCADCVKLFRRIFNFDHIREEELMEVQYGDGGQGDGGAVLSTSGGGQGSVQGKKTEA